PGFVREENLPALFEIVTSRHGEPELKPDRIAILCRQWQKEKKSLPPDLDVPTEPCGADIEALGVSDPEALAFKMFKNIVERVVPVELHVELGDHFTRIFGKDSFDRV